MTQPEKSTAAATKPARSRPDKKPTKYPMWNVVLLDDDDHTYEYVIEMLQKLFAHNKQRAYLMACEVDNTGRVIVETTTKERAEFKRDQIHAYGKDHRITRCAGSMSATIEPAENA